MTYSKFYRKIMMNYYCSSDCSNKLILVSMKNFLHEIIDEQYIDNILIMIAKQISIYLGQVRSSMWANSQNKSNSFNYEQTSQRNGSFIEQKQNNTNQQIFAIFLIYFVKGQSMMNNSLTLKRKENQN